ncbi:MAG: hypothetical protein Q7R90_00555 [bacterium]|nr:hypothetical protein [bacterium]
MEGTQQVTLREMRGLFEEIFNRMQSPDSVAHLVRMRRHFRGENPFPRRNFSVLIGQSEYGPDGLIPGLQSGLGTKWAMADDLHADRMLEELPQEKKTHIVKVWTLSVREMGFESDSVVWYDQIVAWAASKKVPPIPGETAPAMLLQVRDEAHVNIFHDIITEHGVIHFLMNPRRGRDWIPRIFRLGYGYIPNRLRSQYFLWSLPVAEAPVAFTTDAMFAVADDITEVGSAKWVEQANRRPE